MFSTKALLKEIRQSLIETFAREDKKPGIFFHYPQNVHYPYILLEISQYQRRSYEAIFMLSVKIFSLQEETFSAETLHQYIEKPFEKREGLSLKDQNGFATFKKNDQKIYFSAPSTRIVELVYSGFFKKQHTV